MALPAPPSPTLSLPGGPRGRERELGNVVLTSHRGWTTHETLDRFMAGAVENVLAFLAGAPRNAVNPAVLLR